MNEQQSAAMVRLSFTNGRATFTHDGRPMPVLTPVTVRDAIAARQSLQWLVDVMQPTIEDARVPLEWKPDGTAVYRRRKAVKA